MQMRTSKNKHLYIGKYAARILVVQLNNLETKKIHKSKIMKQNKTYQKLQFFKL